MNNLNQPACPPRIASYDMALDHKITNQYMNNMQPVKQQSSIYTQNVPMPIKGGSTYSTVPQNNYYNSMNRQNNQGYPPRVQQRLNSNNGDLSLQPINNTIPPLANNNANMINPPQFTDFNNNFYQNNNQVEEIGFFNVLSNLKKIFTQNQLSKWTFIIIILQVIIIVTLESLIFFNNAYFNEKFKNIYLQYESKEDPEYERLYKESTCLVVYQFIFVIAQIFVLAIYYDSFRISSSIQLITTSIFNFIIAAYSLIQIMKITNLFKDISKTNIIQTYGDEELINLLNAHKYKLIYYYVISNATILTVSATVIAILSLFLFKKFGWNIYRNVGADIKKTIILKRRYKFGIVLKFKSFFIFGIIAQLYIIKNDINNTFNKILKLENAENDNIIIYILTSALSFILLINILCGYYGVRLQSTFIMFIHILTDFVFIVFSVYMIYCVFIENRYMTVKKFFDRICID